MIKSGDGFIQAHLIRHRYLLLGIIVLGWINSIVSFLLPLSIGEFFTVFFHTGSSKGKLLNWLGIEVTTAGQFFLLFSLLLGIKAILTFFENYGTFFQGELLVRNIRDKVFASQMNWNPVWLQGRSYGKYLLRYSNDMKSIQLYMTKGYLEAIKSGLFLLTGLLLMVQIQAIVTLLFFILLFIGFLVVFRAARYQSRSISESRSARSSLLAHVAHSFSRFTRIKDHREEPEAIDTFREKSGTLFGANMKYNLTESLMLALVPLLIFGIIGLLLWQMEFLADTITASEGLMMVLMILMMEGGVRRLLKVPSYINKGRISLQKINKLLNEPPLSSRPEKTREEILDVTI